MSVGHRSENYHYLIALDEARTAYEAFEKKVKYRAMQPKEKEFSAAAVKAFHVPVEMFDVPNCELLEPLTLSPSNFSNRLNGKGCP